MLDLSKFIASADDNFNVARMSKLSVIESKILVIESVIESKTLWEKEKMLVASVFSFSHIVFKCSFSQGR